MVGIEDSYDLWLGGKKLDKGAYVAVSLYGNAPKESYDRCYGHYIKYSMRNALDIATTGCSVNVRLSEDKKTFERVRIGYGVASPIPVRAPSAEAFINGKEITDENIKKFALTVLEDINPRDSWRAGKALRQHISVVMAERALRECITLAGGEVNG